MIDTTALMKAAFACTTDAERMICRDLATSIEARSPYAWNIYYTGEADRCLSENSIKALEIVMRRAEKFEEKLAAKKKLKFEKPSPRSPEIKRKGGGAASSGKKKPPLNRSRVQRGVKISDVVEIEVKKEDAPSNPPTVYALMAPQLYSEKDKKGRGRVVVGEPSVHAKDKGKAIVKEEPVDDEPLQYKDKGKAKVKEEVVEDDESDDEMLTFDEDELWCDIFVEDEAGELKLFKIVADYDDDAGSGAEIPMSPNCSHEWDPENHFFLVIHKGTLPSS
ncbi:tRNA-2-methylthio-N(6)-dimethylallyladenosine synthase [Bienertia sinuspersici]